MGREGTHELRDPGPTYALRGPPCGRGRTPGTDAMKDGRRLPMAFVSFLYLWETAFIISALVAVVLLIMGARRIGR